MEIHLHPDNLVYVRSGKAVLYADTKQNFESDYGQVLDQLPESFSERIYIHGKMDRLANEFTNETFEREWAQGSDIISNIDKIKEAKELRNKPKVKPPSQEEIEKQQAKSKLESVNVDNLQSLEDVKELLKSLVTLNKEPKLESVKPSDAVESRLIIDGKRVK